MQLKKDLSQIDLLFMALSSIIGSGWLFGAFYAAKFAGPSAMLSWLIGGFFIAIIALTIAEVSTLLPATGGSIAYATMSHGPFCGAIFAWATWLWTMVVPASEVWAVIQYSSNYFPGIFNPKTHTLTFNGFLMAAAIMFLVSGIHLLGVKIFAKTNGFIGFWKLVIPFTIAAVLMTYKTNTSNLTSAGGFVPNGYSGIFSAISNCGIAMSFFGFQTGIFVAGESKNPQKAIPFSLFGSLSICIILYVCLQYGFIVSLSPSSLSNGWGALSFVGDAGPFAGILAGMGLFFLVKVLYFDAVMSPLGTAANLTIASSRILYSLGVQHDAPAYLSKLNRFSSPWAAVLTNFAIGMLFFLPFSGWQEMASFITAAMMFTLVCGPICLPIYRKSFPDLPRSFKLPVSNLISISAFYFGNLILHWSGWNTIFKFDIALAVGVVVYFVARLVKSNLTRESLHLKSVIWVFVYLVFVNLISYYSQFGGGLGVTTMSQDFILIFVMTLVVYFVAQKTALNAKSANTIYNTITSEKLIVKV